METKDWIVLLVPIVINGICLFIFQQMINRRIKRMEMKTDYRHEILKGFLTILQDTYQIYNKLIRAKPESVSGIDDFANIWNSTHEQMQSMVVYFNTHRAVLINLEDYYDSCVDEFHGLIDILSEGVSPDDQDFYYSVELIHSFTDRYILLDNLLRELLVQCEKELLRFI